MTPFLDTIRAGRRRWLAVAAGFGLALALSACAVVDSGRAPAGKASDAWVVLPIANYTETPQAGLRAESIAMSLLKARGFSNLKQYPPSLNSESLFEPAEREATARALEWARGEKGPLCPDRRGVRMAVQGGRGRRARRGHHPAGDRRAQRQRDLERHRQPHRLEPRRRVGRGAEAAARAAVAAGPELMGADTVQADPSTKARPAAAASDARQQDRRRNAQGIGASTWYGRLVAPTLTRRTPILETIGATMVAIGIVWLFEPNNPLLLGYGFPWIWLVPLILALRYGTLLGAVAALVVVGAWWVFYGQGTFPRMYFLGGLMMMLVGGQYGDIWGARLSRARIVNGYLNDRLAALTKNHFLLRLSHERLENDLLAQADHAARHAHAAAQPGAGRARACQRRRCARRGPAARRDAVPAVGRAGLPAGSRGHGARDRQPG